MKTQKTFKKKDVSRKIKDVLKVWKSKELSGKTFSLNKFLGGYQYNSMNRYIKEVLFFNTGDISGRNGGTWYLQHPTMTSKKDPKKLAKKVMKAINVT